MVSRDEAAEIARNDVQTHQLGLGVSKILSIDEITGRLPYVYNVSLSECWIAYVETLPLLALDSSTIVVIARDTGKVVYHGSASDEG